jgi:hypothetical protein
LSKKSVIQPLITLPEHFWFGHLLSACPEIGKIAIPGHQKISTVAASTQR